MLVTVMPQIKPGSQYNAGVRAVSWASGWWNRIDFYSSTMCIMFIAPNQSSCQILNLKIAFLTRKIDILLTTLVTLTAPES